MKTCPSCQQVCMSIHPTCILAPTLMVSFTVIVVGKGCWKSSALTNIVMLIHALSLIEIFFEDIWLWLLVPPPKPRILSPGTGTISYLWKRILWFRLLDSTRNAYWANSLRPFIFWWCETIFFLKTILPLLLNGHSATIDPQFDSVVSAQSSSDSSTAQMYC